MKKLAYLLLVAATATTLRAADNAVMPAEAEQGWLLLFDGDSIFGWTPKSGASWRATGGMLQPATDAGVLQSGAAFADFVLQFEYNAASAATNCAVMLRAAADGDPMETGYVLQVGNGRSGWPTGSIVEHFRARGAGSATNRWHSVEATLAGPRITVKVDGTEVVDGRNARSRAGVLALACRTAGAAQFRNIKIRPLQMTPLFNGTDLAGWKIVGPPPAKPGMLKKIVGAGGSPREAAWSVANGAVHGERGTGQLESAAMYDDFVLQLGIRVNSRDRGKHPKSGISFRGDAGQLFDGYGVNVMNDRQNRNGRPAIEVTGGLRGLQAPRRMITGDNVYFTKTIAVQGRRMLVWVDGFPVIDFQDTRAEGKLPEKEARTAAGTIALQAIDEETNVDFRDLKVVALPRALGKAADGAAPALPIPTPAGAPGAPAAEVDASKAAVQPLMAQALATNDPQRQVELYTRILLLDPSNEVAFSGRQQAQAKVDAANAERAEARAKAENVLRTEAQNQTEGAAAKQRAEDAFLSGDMQAARTQLGIAEKLLPGDSRLQQLRTRLDQATASRQRLLYSLTGAGALALIAGLVLLVRRRGGATQAYLEVIDGIEKGKRYNLEQDVIRIGAIAQDGEYKNEVVVRDLERLISRFHCEIHKRNGDYFLIDRDSANGTKVDRKAAAAQPVRLKRGARIDLAGACTLRLGFEKVKSQAKQPR